MAYLLSKVHYVIRVVFVNRNVLLFTNCIHINQYFTGTMETAVTQWEINSPGFESCLLWHSFSLYPSSVF